MAKLSPKHFRLALGIALPLLGFQPSTNGQAIDALLDALVDKGILSVKEADRLRAATDKSFNEALQTKFGTPDWVTALKIRGDLRARYDSINIEDDAGIDRDRYRFRLRVGAVATLLDDFEIGFRFSSDDPARNSGLGGNPLSGNVTFGGNGAKKFLFIDQAYAKWSPIHGDTWNASLSVGKMENPFVASDILFDPDLTPEGAVAQIAYNINPSHVIRATAGGFVLNELSLDTRDPYMYAGQFRYDAQWSSKIQSSVGIGSFNIVNRHNLLTTTMPNQNLGNTREPSSSILFVGDFNPQYNFNPIVIDGSITYTLSSFPLYEGAFPIRIAGDYMNNPGAPSSQNSAYSAGITLGRSGRRRTWEAIYRYRYLESDAWFEEMVDADWGSFYGVPPASSGFGFLPIYGAGTNVRGHLIRLNYSILNSFTVRVSYFLTEAIDNPTPAFRTGSRRFMVDAFWQF